MPLYLKKGIYANNTKPIKTLVFIQNCKCIKKNFSKIIFQKLNIKHVPDFRKKISSFSFSQVANIKISGNYQGFFYVYYFTQARFLQIPYESQ